MHKRNAAKCLFCGDELESTHRHDYRACSCGQLVVDGGLDYIRRGGNPELIEEMNEDEPEPR